MNWTEHLLGCTSKFCAYSEYHVHVIFAGNCIVTVVVFVFQRKPPWEFTAEKNVARVAFFNGLRTVRTQCRTAVASLVYSNNKGWRQNTEFGDVCPHKQQQNTTGNVTFEGSSHNDREQVKRLRGPTQFNFLKLPVTSQLHSFDFCRELNLDDRLLLQVVPDHHCTGKERPIKYSLINANLPVWSASDLSPSSSFCHVTAVHSITTVWQQNRVTTGKSN